jgi:hypothetical protein
MPLSWSETFKVLKEMDFLEAADGVFSDELIDCFSIRRM